MASELTLDQRVSILIQRAMIQAQKERTRNIKYLVDIEDFLDIVYSKPDTLHVNSLQIGGEFYWHGAGKNGILFWTTTKEPVDQLNLVKQNWYQ